MSAASRPRKVSSEPVGSSESAAPRVGPCASATMPAPAGRASATHVASEMAATSRAGSSGSSHERSTVASVRAASAPASALAISSAELRCVSLASMPLARSAALAAEAAPRRGSTATSVSSPAFSAPRAARSSASSSRASQAFSSWPSQPVKPQRLRSSPGARSSAMPAASETSVPEPENAAMSVGEPWRTRRCHAPAASMAAA